MRFSTFSQVGAYGIALAVLGGCAGSGDGVTSFGGASPRGAMSARRRPVPPPNAAFARNLVAQQPARAAAIASRIAGLPQGAPNAKAGYAFVSDEPTQTIFVFDPSGNVAGVVTNDLYYPEGLATDAAEHLYVANAGDSNVLVFTKPYQGTPSVYQDPDETPSGVAAMPDGSLIAVTNIEGTGNATGDVVFYKKGASTPCATVSDPNWGEMFFGGFDAAGDLFIDGLHSIIGPVLVGEIKGGCNATSIQTLTTANSTGKLGGVQVDQNGNVSIEDQSNAAIYTYAPPSGGSFGMPLFTTPLSGAKDPVSFAFALNEKYVVAADALAPNAPAYAFPAGGPAVRIFKAPFSEPIGTAVIPSNP